MTLLGAVLAGGESRRFGTDKLAARLGDRTLLDHAIGWVSARSDAIVLCGREVPGIACVADWPAPGLGPLGGLAAALRYAVAHGHDAVLSIPGDTPVLPPQLFEQLHAAGAPVFVRGCPVIGLWPASADAGLSAWLERGEDRSMRGWARSIDARVLELSEPIANVNYVTDLTALERP